MSDCLQVEYNNGDGDGLILSDKNGDRCYVYFSEIPEVIVLLKKHYSIWRNGYDNKEDG